MLMSETVDVGRLEWLANNTPVNRNDALALAVALDEGKITDEEATEALEYSKDASELEFVQSDHYPGDQFYDKADLRYGGVY